MPLDKAHRDWLCCDTLNAYLFDKVWNEPFSEYRVNIHPFRVKNQSVVGSFSTYDANLVLPTSKDAYFVWAFSAEDFNCGLKLPTLTWVNTQDICNDYHTLIHMYGVSGSMFQKESVYLMYNMSRSVIFIAAKKRMVLKAVPPQSLEDVFLTIYYDSDLANPVHCLSVMLDNVKKQRDAQQVITEFLGGLRNPDHLSVYKNGMDITDPNNIPVVGVGDYYDFIIDENIVFSFDIDLPPTNQNPTFLSEKDKTWKQLVHIPKALNPDNKIITKNTCDFTVRKRYSNSVEGLYLHRASYNRTVSQVTHNDMAIPLFILDAYRDYLQTQEISLHCVVRIHDKDNHLIRDASYIDLLYNDVHDDERIIEILCGRGPEQIPWWKASDLEQSRYVEMMFDTPDMVSMDNIKNCVEALGYYSVVNLLCHRIIDTKITDAYTGTLIYQLPILYAGMKVLPVVYLNGTPVPRQYISYYCDTNNDTVEITLAPQIATTPGDILTVMFFVDGDRSIISFTPTDTANIVTVPFDDVIVYRRKQTSTTKGITHSTNTAWVRCRAGSNVFVAQKLENGGTSLTFNAQYSGYEFIVQCAYCSIVQTHNLKSYTETGATISLLIEGAIKGRNDFAPITEFKNVTAFLNGHYLVRGVDYFVKETYDEAGDYAFAELVIQTMDYFNEGGEDILDVIYSVAEIEELSCGFSILNILQDETPVNLYFPNISAAHVDGKLYRDVDYKGTYIQLHDDPPSTGATFEIQTSVPQIVKDFIQNYARNEDLERIKILNDYFYPLVRKNVDVLVLEKKHRIYSVMMNTFIHDILYGKLGLVADPDENRMAGQIAPYLKLKEYDLCFQGLDQRFIDYYPQYVNYEVTPEIKAVIDKYIALYMPKNEDPTLEVVYE